MFIIIKCQFFFSDIIRKLISFENSQNTLSSPGHFFYVISSFQNHINFWCHIILYCKQHQTQCIFGYSKPSQLVSIKGIKATRNKNEFWFIRLNYWQNHSIKNENIFFISDILSFNNIDWKIQIETLSISLTDILNSSR